MIDLITAADRQDKSRGKKKWARQLEKQMQQEINDLEDK